jgi:hypothetical protein
MIKAGLTLAQMVRASRAVKSLPKAKIAKLPQMPKKTGWRKSAFGKTFPSYTRKDLAIDASLLAGGFGISKAFGIGWHKDKKKKKKKKKKT